VSVISTFVLSKHDQHRAMSTDFLILYTNSYSTHMKIDISRKHHKITSPCARHECICGSGGSATLF